MARIISKTVRPILAKPPVAWCRWCEANVDHNNDKLRETSASLGSLCTWIARCYGYVNARSLGMTHSQGVKRSNALATKVRRAIGYSYPQDDITF
jgi:hypothetical protein